MMLGYLLVGALAIMASASNELVLIVLGPRWNSAAPVLEALALGGVFQALGYAYYWAFLAKARVGVLFACELFGRIAMIGLVLWAGFGGAGPVGVALAMSAGLTLIWMITTA